MANIAGAQGAELVSGSMYLPGGMDSYTQPTALDATEVVASMNTVCRGGKYRTRPGTKILANLTGSNLQGGEFFLPNQGTAAFVVVLDGKVYVANSPFREFVQLSGLQFNPLSKFVSLTVCQQSTDYDNAGQLFFLETPKSILIMQDGVTRAAYWDGVTWGHINPTPSGSTTTVPDRDGTKIGLWSVWSNNRLWVSRDNQVFASDIGNPLKFTETQYLNEGRAFYLSGSCTGIIETPDRSGIICFTNTDGTLIRSSIQDREQWLDTEGFVKVILPNSGCVAPRSLINQYGQTWWFSATGLQNLDSALNQNITSKIIYQDNEMAASKQNIAPDMSGICTAAYENYLLVSVPSGDNLNRHTWCLDQAPFEGNINSWPSYWTGWRPVQWAKGVISGRERVFFVSKDYDNVCRLWEAFQAEHTDNGCAITCFLQTKQETFGDVFRKRFQWSRMFLSDLWGNISYRWWLLPQNGAPVDLGTKEIVATPGQVYDNQFYNTGGNLFRANRPQTRTAYSLDSPDGMANCTTCGIEKDTEGILDWAFGMFILWSGDMAISGYQMWVSKDPELLQGKCEENEEGLRSVNYDGCGGNGLFPDGNPFGPVYTATATACVEGSESSSQSGSESGSDSGPGSDSGSESNSSSGSSSAIGTVCSTQTKTSLISQADADRRAACAANFDASFRAKIYI